MRIEYMALRALRRWPRNAKRHRLDRLEESFRRFGFVMPPMIDENAGRLVAGHGRIDGLEARKRAGQPPPDRVEDRGDDWYVPVLRGVRFRDEREAEAYLLADNRISELGGYDNAELLASLQHVGSGPDGLTGVGWTEGEVAELVKTAGDEALGNGDGGSGAPDQSARARVGFAVLIECASEAEQLMVIERAQAEGWKCRALV